MAEGEGFVGRGRWAEPRWRRQECGGIKDALGGLPVQGRSGERAQLLVGGGGRGRCRRAFCEVERDLSGFTGQENMEREQRRYSKH